MGDKREDEKKTSRDIVMRGVLVGLLSLLIVGGMIVAALSL